MPRERHGVEPVFRPPPGLVARGVQQWASQMNGRRGGNSRQNPAYRPTGPASPGRAKRAFEYSCRPVAPHAPYRRGAAERTHRPRAQAPQGVRRGATVSRIQRFLLIQRNCRLRGAGAAPTFDSSVRTACAESRRLQHWSPRSCIAMSATVRSLRIALQAHSFGPRSLRHVDALLPPARSARCDARLPRHLRPFRFPGLCA